MFITRIKGYCDTIKPDFVYSGSLVSISANWEFLTCRKVSLLKNACQIPIQSIADTDLASLTELNPAFDCTRTNLLNRNRLNHTRSTNLPNLSHLFAETYFVCEV